MRWILYVVLFTVMVIVANYQRIEPIPVYAHGFLCLMALIVIFGELHIQFKERSSVQQTRG